MDRNETYSLFDNTMFEGSNISHKNGLRIVAGRKTLSKSQLAFNKLTGRVERLQDDIKSETAKLESLLKVYVSEIPVFKQRLAKTRLALAKALGNSTETIKYGRQQRENIREVILHLCDLAFADNEPDKETEAFYDSWSESSYREELQTHSAIIKQMVADGAKDFLGIDLNADEIDDTPEGLARLMNRLKNEMHDQEQRQGVRSSKRKKSKKQLEREERQKSEEALQLKSLRAIYLSLAKALHPDTTMDPLGKIQKETLMKKVTAAYAEKDLTTLLKLELEWVSSENATLDTLPEERLKRYIVSLKEQVSALEQEKYALYHHPRFICISEFSGFPLAHAKKCIHDQARDHGMAIKEFEKIIAAFSKPNPKKEILKFISEYSEMMDVMDAMHDTDDLDPFSQNSPF